MSGPLQDLTISVGPAPMPIVAMDSVCARLRGDGGGHHLEDATKAKAPASWTRSRGATGQHRPPCMRGRPACSDRGVAQVRAHGDTCRGQAMMCAELPQLDGWARDAS